jgi:hypothetical protein
MGAVVCIGRVLAAAVNEAYDLDEQDKRPLGKEPVGKNWHLREVLDLYKSPDTADILLKAVNATGDDRMAANHADGFQLADDLYKLPA